MVYPWEEDSWAWGWYCTGDSVIQICDNEETDPWASAWVHELFHHIDHYLGVFQGVCVNDECEADDNHNEPYWDDVSAVMQGG